MVSINHNPTFRGALTDYGRFDRFSQTHQQNLSSGLRINKSGDGTGYLSISEGMRAEIGGLAQGSRNVEQALNLVQTASGTLNEVSAMLVRMRGLAVQTATSTLSDTQRENAAAEFSALMDEIDRTAKITHYNNQPLLAGFGTQLDTTTSTALVQQDTTGLKGVQISGAQSGSYRFLDNPSDNSITLGNGTITQTLYLGTSLVNEQVATGSTVVADFDRLGIQITLAGPQVTGLNGNYEDGDLDGHTLQLEEGIGGSLRLGGDSQIGSADRIDYNIRDMTISGGLLNLSSADIGTMAAARSAVAQIDRALQNAALERGNLGALTNRLQHTLNYATTALERVQASESTIRDADYATESSQLARYQILQQTSTAAMRQSRLIPERLLTLLQ